MYRIIFALLLLTGCAAPEIASLFRDISPSPDSTYGYTAENPIRIGYYDPRKSIEAASYFLSHLKTTKGQRLNFLSRESVDDPKHNPSKSRFSAPEGGILDLYVFVPEGTADTSSLFVDIYHQGTLRIPTGLRFDDPTNQK